MPADRSSRSAPFRAAAPCLACAVVLAACASGGSAPSAENRGPQQNTMRVEGGGTNLELQSFRNDRNEATAFATSADSLFRAVRTVYETLALPVNSLLPAQRRIAAIDVRVRRAIGKERLSRYLSCGDNVTGVANADLYDVVLSVTSQVAPGQGSGSVLTTLVTATARPTTSGGAPVTCASTGMLEARIASESRKQLGI